MTKLEREKYFEDLNRNGSDIRTKIFLWCFRTLCSKQRSFFKFIAKIGREFFKTSGIYINSKSIGGGLRMPHLNGIIIHKNAKLGKNVIIFHQVTIGVNERKNPHAAPIIGDNVYIGAGAKIIGDIVVEDDVTIGANAVVTKCIPAGSTVVGYNKIISSKES